MVQFTTTGASTQSVYLTIGRSTATPTTANTTNLCSSGGFISAANISGAGYHMASVYTATAVTETMTLFTVDNPATAATYYYSLFGITSTGAVTPEVVNITVLQVLP